MKKQKMKMSAYICYVISIRHFVYKLAKEKIFMRKIFTRIAAAVTAAAVILTTAVFDVPGRILAASVVASGSCGANGDNVKWSLDSSGKLTISGSGAMDKFGASFQPWSDYRNDITTVVIESGVTAIGDENFYGFSKVTSVILNEGLQIIGSNAFAYCRSLSSVTIPASVTEINSAAFYTANLSEVYFKGKNPPSYVGVLVFITIGSGSSEQVADIYVPCGAVNSYWNKFHAKDDEYRQSKFIAYHIPYTKTSAKAATCTANGNIEYWTCGCSSKIKFSDAAGTTEVTNVTISALDHSYDTTTWSNDGTNHWHDCTRCGAKGDNAAHTWNSGTVTTAATCTSTGVKTYTCTACNREKTEDIEKAAHTAVKTAAKAATCTEDGNVEYWHCSECNTNFSDSACTNVLTDTVIGKTGHSAAKTAAKSATCTEDGNVEYWHCSKCNINFSDSQCTKEITDTVIGKTGHSYGAAWTTNDTQHWYECTECGNKKNTAAHSFTQNKNASNHWQECVCGYTKDITAHTFIQEYDGTNHWQECTECGTEKDTEAHIFTEQTNETCRWKECDVCKYITGMQEHVYRQGYDTTNHWYECTACGTKKGEAEHSFTQEKDDDSHWLECGCGYTKDNEKHDWIESVIIPATCTDAGTEKCVCSDCGTEKTDNIPVDPDAHDWGDPTIIHEPSKTDKGTIRRICNIDPEHIETEEMPELTDDDFWTLTDSTAPSCTENGYEIYECAYGKVTVTLLSAGHISVTDDKIEPTCVDTGLTEGSHCEVCDEVFTEQRAIDPLGHDWDEGEITAPSDCTHSGVKTFTCSRCGETENKDIEVEGHTEVPDEAIPATCTETGKTAGSHCGVCGTVIEAQEEIPALGHSWDEGKVTTPAGEDTEGVRTYTCTVCGTVRTETIPATGGSTAPVNPDNPDPDKPDPDKPDPDNPDPDKPENPDDTDNGNISKEVRSEENVPDTTLVTPLDELADAVLTPEEQELIDDGVDIKIVLTIEDGTDSAPDDDKAKVETAISELSDYTIGQYLDVNLLKIIGNSQEKITETNVPITIMFELPEALRGEGRTYVVIRIHNGETAVLFDLDGDTNTVTIETNRFSTYALTYSEKTNAAPSNGGSSGGSHFISPDEGGSDGVSTALSESESTNGGNSAPSESTPANGSNSASSENNSIGNGYTPSENGGSSDNDTIPPSNEASSANNNGTNSDGTSIDNSSSASNKSADTDNNNNNPPTGIAISLIPLAAITVITAVSVKSKKK